MVLNYKFVRKASCPVSADDDDDDDDEYDNDDEDDDGALDMYLHGVSIDI